MYASRSLVNIKRFIFLSLSLLCLVYIYIYVDALSNTWLFPCPRYIFGVHPHSILPFGAMIALSNEKQEGFHVCREKKNILFLMV